MQTKCKRVLGQLVKQKIKLKVWKKFFDTYMVIRENLQNAH